MIERCAPHGLAIGPDGRCVLCRRESASAAPEVPWAPDPPRTIRVPTSSLVFVALALVIGVGYAFLRRPDATSASSAQALVPSDGVEVREGRSAAKTPDRARTERSIPEARELPEREGPLPTRVVLEEEVRGAPAPSAPSAKKDAPSADEVRAALRSVRITMYTTQWCPHCTRARNWLRANNFAYTELDVEASESARRDRDRINPSGGVPTVDIDGEVLTGFGERNWSGAIGRATQRKLAQRAR